MRPSLSRFKVFLKSRSLFRNWLSAGLRYMLIKHSLAREGIDVAFRCGSKAKLSSPIYSWLVKNYSDGLIEDIVCDENIYILYTPRRGIEVDIELGDKAKAEFNYLGKKVALVLDDLLSIIDDIILENFYGGAYNDLDVESRVIVDVGAGVGDTAILFTLRGARKIIALEPYLGIYSIALENVKLNNISDRVILLNAGLGGHDGYICVSEPTPRGYYPLKPGVSEECLAKARIYSLKSLVDEYSIYIRNAVLKMDCEGCEYDVFAKAEDDVIRRFEQIEIEYHNGYSFLEKRLRELGFETRIKPIISIQRPVEVQGYVIAKRRS
jgi:FkbM family methyltransferase